MPSLPDDDSLPARLREFMDRAGLSAPAMAAHCGVPLGTLKGLLYSRKNYTGRRGGDARAKIEAGMRTKPAKQPRRRRTPSTPHVEYIRDNIATEGAPAIAKRLEISPQRVRKIARRWAEST